MTHPLHAAYYQATREQQRCEDDHLNTCTCSYAAEDAAWDAWVDYAVSAGICALCETTMDETNRGWNMFCKAHRPYHLEDN